MPSFILKIIIFVLDFLDWKYHSDGAKCGECAGSSGAHLSQGESRTLLYSQLGMHRILISGYPADRISG
jgi:hypothetical protein